MGLIVLSLINKYFAFGFIVSNLLPWGVILFILNNIIPSTGFSLDLAEHHTDFIFSKIFAKPHVYGVIVLFVGFLLPFPYILALPVLIEIFYRAYEKVLKFIL